ncbi:MAG: hypothetical protein WA280_17945, partial [Xanthobacteraceae bacterium]
STTSLRVDLSWSKASWHSSGSALETTTEVESRQQATSAVHTPIRTAPAPHPKPQHYNPTTGRRPQGLIGLMAIAMIIAVTRFRRTLD